MDAGGQESVKNYVDRMQAGLRQRLGVGGAGVKSGMGVGVAVGEGVGVAMGS